MGDECDRWSGVRGGDYGDGLAPRFRARQAGRSRMIFDEFEPVGLEEDGCLDSDGKGVRGPGLGQRVARRVMVLCYEGRVSLEC